jgi:hypothetical protein
MFDMKESRENTAQVEHFPPLRYTLCDNLGSVRVINAQARASAHVPRLPCATVSPSSGCQKLGSHAEQ